MNRETPLKIQNNNQGQKQTNQFSKKLEKAFQNESWSLMMKAKKF